MEMEAACSCYLKKEVHCFIEQQGVLNCWCCRFGDSMLFFSKMEIICSIEQELINWCISEKVEVRFIRVYSSRKSIENG